jgi:hypothetical protein
MRERERKEGGIRWMKEIWKGRERIEKERSRGIQKRIYFFELLFF